MDMQKFFGYGWELKNQYLLTFAKQLAKSTKSNCLLAKVDCITLEVECSKF